jgi:AraC-like DNA-binding protein
LFPKWRAQRYIEEEEVVMRERLVQDYEEYQFNADGVVERWRTIKAPWVVDDEVIGYINLGISMGGALERRQDQLPPLVQELMKRACTHQSIDDICKELGVSRRTFERRFRAVMNETPQQFRLKCRLVKASMTRATSAEHSASSPD